MNKYCPLTPLIATILLVSTHNIFCYRLPGLNLGLTSFLDGGPIRPNPGWYQETYLNYYTAHSFLDGCGDPLGGTFLHQPKFSSLAAIFQVIYQGNYNFLRGMPGFGIGLPICLQSQLDENKLGIIDTEKGVGDLGLGIFLQFYPLWHKKRPIYVHRIQLSMAIPTGNTGPINEITFGKGYYAVTPYWSATLFVTSKIALSWRLHYVWTLTTHKKTHIHPGQATYLNFNGAYELFHNFWIGINGYFLQQIQNDTLLGVTVPNSRERTMGIGPGMVYHFAKHFYLFGNCYIETMARNRPQGINGVLRLVIRF